MLTQEIRRNFLKYFKDKQHAIISSSPVVPHEDPTLLFTNAGMNQFKDTFLGKGVRDYQRAATSQKCIRVGGKHNDFENVGHTRRHLTFFEMLGNFSFGDYFKEEAIQYAWEVSTQVFGFDPQKIWPSVFREDHEAFEIWCKYVPAERITRLGEKDNFWEMGETGPCGPCSELYFDRGPKYGTASKLIEDPDGDRFFEFWNLVFMQFNRQEGGALTPLPKPSIDTGAGIERVVGLKMGVDSVFETDVLRSLIDRTEQITGIKYDMNDKIKAPAFRVIADHLRCLAFAISDGAQPSNVDRGYVLRKVLRRAVRYGRTLGMEDPFLAKILPRLVETMGSDYPELIKGEVRIAEILTSEEEAFMRTLKRGGNILSQIIEASQAHKQISGDDAFKLKDTYGLPLEEITILAKDAGLGVDLDRYQALEQEAKERSRSVHKAAKQIVSENLFASFLKEKGPTEFLGYSQKNAQATILALVVDKAFVDRMNSGEEGLVILDCTPFYAEMGGQVGDTGTISTPEALFQVKDSQSPYKGIISHVGRLEKGLLTIGDKVEVEIDQERRQKIANNHTATHLLHWALQKVIGEHIKQAGSVVDPDRLRFDFSHHKALTQEEIRQIEDLVNSKIRENRPVNAYELDYEDVRHRDDIKQFFGEKYGSKVRVIDIDNYSKELCGGTHTSAAGNIGYFRIAKEGSISAGIRRIEAVTGPEAEELSRESENLLTFISDKLKTPVQKLAERFDKMLEENKQLANSIKELKKNQMASLLQQLTDHVEMIKGIPFLAANVPLNAEELRLFADMAMDKMKQGVLVLGCGEKDRCQLIIRVSSDLQQKGLHAGNMVKALAPLIEGSGGGKADSAQAGGKAPHKLTEVFAQARRLLQSD